MGKSHSSHSLLIHPLPQRPKRRFWNLCPCHGDILPFQSTVQDLHSRKAQSCTAALSGLEGLLFRSPNRRHTIVLAARLGNCPRHRTMMLALPDWVLALCLPMHV